ncbi:hypothetical protein [Streptomyces sp. NPDC056105]
MPRVASFGTDVRLVEQGIGRMYYAAAVRAGTFPVR